MKESLLQALYVPIFIIITLALSSTFSYRIGTNRRIFEQKRKYSIPINAVSDSTIGATKVQSTSTPNNKWVSNKGTQLDVSNTPKRKYGKRNNNNSTNIVLGQMGMGSAINDFIIKYFNPTTNNNKDTNSQFKLSSNFTELQTFLYKFENQLTSVHVVTLMLNCARHKITVSNIVPISFINKILNNSINSKVKRLQKNNNITSSTSNITTTTTAITNNDDDIVFKPRELANALYGLKSIFTDNHNNNNNKNSPFYSTTSSSSSSSSSNTHSNSHTTGLSRDQTELIQTLIKMITMCQINPLQQIIFTSQHIAGSYYGLQNLKSDIAVVRQLLYTLNNKIKQSITAHSVQFNDIEIGLALYGQ